MSTEAIGTTTRRAQGGTYAVCLLLFGCFLFLSSEAALAASDTTAVTSGTFLAMGGRDDAALTPRNAGSGASMTEQAFGGSFLGALLFGYPYSGFGTVDVVALGVLVLVVLRVMANRSRNRGKDRFTVHTRNGNLDPREPEPTRPDNGREPPRPSGGGNPRDNAWSRKLGGMSGAPGRDSDETGGASPWNAGRNNSEQAPKTPPLTVQRRAEAMWAHLSGSGQEAEKAPEAFVADGAHVPAGFDVNDFLEGARALYVRLQKAWASRELESLEPFVSARMMEMLQRQADKDPTPVPVDIMLVNATLQGVSPTAGGEGADVLFNVLMRAGGAQQPGEVNEVWRFERSSDSDGMWRLTGIRAFSN